MVGAWVRSYGELALAALAGVICLVALNLADVVTTRIALHLATHHGHLLVEGNPLARALLPAGRVELVKACLIVLLAWNTVRRRPTLRVACAVWATVGVYAMTIANNLLAIATMR
jgi:hypothetical protein